MGGGVAAVGFWARMVCTTAATLVLAGACWLGLHAYGVSQATALAVAAIAAGAVVTLLSVWVSRAPDRALRARSEDAALRQVVVPRLPGGRVVVGEIPQEPPAFQNRPELLDAITTGPHAGRRASVVFALTGLRGVGKSQLAAACARRRLDEDWSVVAWLDASDREQLLGGYAQLAAALDLVGDMPDSAEATERVRHWLEADGERCLIVLDNANSADVLRPFLPVAGHSQVIVTSSRRALSDLGAPVPVDMFTDTQAVGFLAERTGLEDVAGALKVAAELGCLPLALAQAAAVISGQGLDYATYLQRLATVTIASYLTRPEEDPYPHGTAEAITLALDAAQQADPTGLSNQLLDVVALLSSAGISRMTLYAAARGVAMRRRRPGFQRRRRQVTEAMVDAALQHLAAWSLVTWSMDRTTVIAHRLVTRVTREREAAHRSLASAAERAISGLQAMQLPEDEAWKHPDLMQDFVQQVTALAEHLDAYPGVLAGQAEADLLRLLGWAGFYLKHVADLSRAVPLDERVLAESERLFGVDHPETLASRSNLASAYLAAGRLDDAITQDEQTLDVAIRVLGPDHRGTLTTRSNLAAAYLAAGRLDEAIALDEQTLADRERVLGLDHPDTLTSRNNLGTAYLRAGRLNEAIALDEQTLADRERVLGLDHPDTLASRNNLARSYESAGRRDEAITLYKQTLAESERTLGLDHPGTMTSRNNLAGAYQGAKRLDEAITMYEGTLADRERVLGPDHPDSLASRNNLATAYRSAGRRKAAIDLLRRTLADSERVLGPNHPLTQTLRRNLARTRSGR